jgi:hypothetical protein
MWRFKAQSCWLTVGFLALILVLYAACWCSLISPPGTAALDLRFGTVPGIIGTAAVA